MILAKLIATLRASIAPAAIRSAAMSTVAPRERTSIMRNCVAYGLPSPERGGSVRQRVRPEVAGPMTSSARRGGVARSIDGLGRDPPPAAAGRPLPGGGENFDAAHSLAPRN